ncbi:hypothetical protein C7447_101493 [Tenacibaculum adriaticum]|uniref:DUF6973 domain-containing protein n=1 Tax=Tenacibaculum adriaticum TaxID=413713 RepID=A0A5S5DXW9_9FLAO|nr:hypothetical protein [Tenacibaculum adriaticum]TYP99886.1 hypothetical protein C7447_101493 [Tenacibaculum adriaticum]
MKNVVFLLILCFTISGFSQSNYQKFKNLSSPKKWWIFFHPFKAKKALAISKEAGRVTDSIRKTSLLDGDHAGGQVDAFRHAFWMARLRQEIGESAARSLGKAHEKENYQYFKENKLEDGVLPDKASRKMDLHNNEIGLSLTRKGEKYTKNRLIYLIVNAIHQGKMLIIKKDAKKRFLTCKGNLINTKTLRGKWENNKCLVKSNEIITDK